MTFEIFTEVTSNLPESLLEGIRLIPLGCTIDDRPFSYNGDLESFGYHEYYTELKDGAVVKTSLINNYTFKKEFSAVLDKGADIICVTMSSGISGTYNAAVIAAEELAEEYPDRRIHIIDSRGCGFGTGLLAVYAARLAKQSVPVDEAAALVEGKVDNACQYFTVYDLMFLRRTGRVHGVAAQLGTMLKINPILFGNSDGLIVVNKKVRGRAKALSALCEIFEKKRLPDQDLPVCISHGDCLEDANELARRIKEIAPEAEVVVAPHEPVSGSHVGPGMLAVFFFGDSR